MSKPSVFIGSSVESLQITHAIQELLEHDTEVTPWSQGIFTPSGNTLDDLVTKLSDFDFGIFVFSPEDIVKIRERQCSAVRDNVLFELGLFVGNLGKKRNFIVMPRGQEDFHFPSDLLGVTPVTFDPNREDGNIQAALGPACNKIRDAIKTQGVREKNSKPQSGKKASSNQSNSEIEVDPEPLNASQYSVTHCCNERDTLSKEEEKLLQVFLDYGKSDDFALTCLDINKYLQAQKGVEDGDVELAITKLKVRGYIAREPGRIKAFSITKLGWKWLSHSCGEISRKEA